MSPDPTSVFGVVGRSSTSAAIRRVSVSIGLGGIELRNGGEVGAERDWVVLVGVRTNCLVVSQTVGSARRRKTLTAIPCISICWTVLQRHISRVSCLILPNPLCWIPGTNRKSFRNGRTMNEMENHNGAQRSTYKNGGKFSLALRGRCIIMPSGRISSHPCSDPPFEALAAIYVPHEECGDAGGNFRYREYMYVALPG